MDVEIIAVGGYNEVGRNMTAVRVGKEIVIFDIGLYLDPVSGNNSVDMENMHSLDLIQIGAIPDDTVMNAVEGTVRAIVCTHGHLDHIGAIQKLAHRYSCPIIATPYTIELIKQQIEGERKFEVTNKTFALKAGGKYTISTNLTLEFIRVQHSIIDSVMAVLHTPVGCIVYANDFKFDMAPVLGEAPDLARIRAIGKEGVKCLIVESLNLDDRGYAPSEQVARFRVRDALMRAEDDKHAIIVSTFASQVARIKTITECAREIDRIPILLGRSMERYNGLAEVMKQVAFPQGTSIYGNRKTTDRMLRRVAKEGPEKFLLVVTGHQGEPGSMLSRMALGETPLKIEKGDRVLFSANIIPNPINYAQRAEVDRLLLRQGARLFDGLHVTGHAFYQEHYDLLSMLNPEHIVPSHGPFNMKGGYVELASEFGYVLNRDVHIMQNGDRLVLPK
ncbi:MAG TPA: RNase J family beta-CASP ribonuclease [Methanocorpusculum sp.]|nr:RNase J family beta-CASP ribonuclease [Candidatus Methanocorpusculum equi]MCQ2357872.1 RNase J family beta-CASP ribonuclease [Methanocorpusculum sp.]HJJ33298.1 RNase J family beta-CASP ribonuclease [Methanocorpusculum sp.]HJJ44909.1 RNase J family beta-CASP ribonuclease [Methanocorpusculum sp.]HJJ58047.1 RNase J family beta-CASP ribonuclease [Methanocorpusculum sp.]